MKDHYDALQFVVQNATKKEIINANFIKTINACVMKHTGSVYNIPLGTVDAGKGGYRKGNVSAGEDFMAMIYKFTLQSEKYSCYSFAG